MLPDRYQWIEREFEPDGDPWLLLSVARDLEQEGNWEGAATVYDRAFGIEPGLEEIRSGRNRVLDRLAVVEHGMTFRYVPGGPFLMGSHDGEPDEKPLHPVWLSPFWIADVPVSWAAFCRLMGWQAPPVGWPADDDPFELDDTDDGPSLGEANKLRLQYCEDYTTRAEKIWGVHDAADTPLTGVSRTDPSAPPSYEHKPMVAVSWVEADLLARTMQSPTVRYSLPTEAQWEKAARGGLIGARHAWGDDPPSPQNCDFGRLGYYAIHRSKKFSPNGYQLYAMNGGVWEWTRDWYDRDYYPAMPERDPEGPPRGEEKVLRGGSWTDCAAAVTVTFRMSKPWRGWLGEDEKNDSARWRPAANVGFRLCRTVRAKAKGSGKRSRKSGK
jgi:formylglycine-generating enzyme required for sulfatase activity